MKSALAGCVRAVFNKASHLRRFSTMPGRDLRERKLDETIYDVIVVGLGPAGIAAVAKLRQREMNVLGLEASARTGGRVHSVPFGNGIIDLGAEWCHGEEDNVVFDMVKDLKILHTSGTTGLDKITFVDSNGYVLTDEMNEKLSFLCCEVTMIAKQRMETNTMSLGENFTAVYQEQLDKPEFGGISKETAGQVLEWFHKYENSIEASDSWYDTSGHSYSEYWECDGDPLLHWNGKGYRTILDVLLNTYPEPHKIDKFNGILRKEVFNISWEETRANKPIVKVHCKDDTVYYGKHVLVTVSLGVLKEHYETMFYPALPEAKINSIKNLSIGTVDKIVLEFETRWWSPSMTWVAFLWSNDMIDSFTDEEKWLTTVFGFNTHNTQKNLICLWITGPSARHMETLPIEVVRNGAMKLMYRFFSDIYNITPLKNIIRSQWYANPYTRGSYSFRSMSTESAGASSEGLAEPVISSSGAPAVCFAGEATSTHYYSTVHGAIESGFRESNRICDYIESKKSVRIASDQNQSMSYKVIIVGAGIAGLGAAKTLASQGITDFKIIESSSRIGGRINTLYFDDGNSIELGAQWIHGSDNNLIRFAKQHDLLSDIVSFEGGGKYLKYDGSEYSQEIVDKINDVVDDIVQKCSIFFETNQNCDFSFGEYLRQEFEIHLKNNVTPDEHTTWRDILDWHVRFHCIDNACNSLDDLSAKAWGQYDYNGGDCQNHINFKKGFNSIVEKLSESIPKDSILSETRVETIDWKTDNKIKVHCSNNMMYEADHVIVTVSLGVLKSEHTTMFKPSLPQEHTEAIDSLGFGRIGKIFLVYDKPWWNDTNGFQLIWSSDAFEKLNKTFTEKEISWLKYITGFDVPNIGPKNILLGWIGCDGDKIQQELSLDDVKDQCHKLLKVFTGNNNLPKPINCYRSLWGKNSNFRGGFSHVTRQCDRYNVEPFRLAKPILNENGKLKLLLAGEACHSTFFSTVHGAFDSGIEQARKICDIYNANVN